MKLVGAARNIERIVRHQRDEHGAAAALVDEIEAVVEELAEQGEPGVERRRQAFVGRGVGDDDVGAVELDAVGRRAASSSASSAASSAASAAFESGQRVARPLPGEPRCPGWRTAAACGVGIGALRRRPTALNSGLSGS